MFLDPVHVLQIRGDEHETEIRFRCYLAKSQNWVDSKRAGFLDQSGEGDLCIALLGGVEELPLTVFDPVKEMQTMPAILRNEWRGSRIHDGNFRGRGDGVKQSALVSSPSHPGDNEV